VVAILEPVVSGFARPENTTPYAAGDCIGTDPGVVASFAMFPRGLIAGYLVEVLLHTNLALWTAPVRLHLYHGAPTAVADRVPLGLLWADVGLSLGSIDLPAFQSAGADSDMACSAWCDVPKRLHLPIRADHNGLLFYRLECLAAQTPGSGQYFELVATAAT
jgi:hypothetical protein